MNVKNISYDAYYAMMCRKYPQKKHCLVTPEDARVIINEMKNKNVGNKKEIKEMIDYIQSIITKNEIKNKK